METTIEELLDQNELLITTVNELQKEAKNRCLEMDKRLSLSATKTSEVVLALNKYEKDIKKIVDDRITSIEASDIIDELNAHIVAINIENNYLREQNDNLKHDLSNLIEMMKQKIGQNDQNLNNHKSQTCLTFCDVDPEDIFGPIEAIISSNGGCFVDEGVQVEINDKCLSRSSSVSNQTKFLVEEKELLIHKLQEHLQTISNELELKDEVVKNLEIKLNTTRKDNSDVRTALNELNQKYDDCERRLQEAIDRVSVLNEHKRSLMTQLDEESEQRIKFKEELKSLTTRLLENMKTVEQQSITIQHLREAIVSKCKLDSTQLNGISFNSSPQDL
jgi:septal ring factor EnvC (AmiA/AmiB activator)